MSTTSKPLIIFSHGNSFPASTYGVLFQSLKTRGFQVKAIEKFGHDPRYSVTSNWPNLVQQLADFTSQEVEKSGQPAFLVGHSLGGFLSLMCAASNPELGGQPVRGVLMIDSPILGGWRAKALGVAKRAQLVGSISPGAISRKRRQQWLGRDEVLAHFRSKKAFARWDEQVLRDYIDHGTHDEGGSAQGQRLLASFAFIQRRLFTVFNVIAQRAVAGGVVHVARVLHTQFAVQGITIGIFQRNQGKVGVATCFESLRRSQCAPPHRRPVAACLHPAKQCGPGRWPACR